MIADAGTDGSLECEQRRQAARRTFVTVLLAVVLMSCSASVQPTAPHDSLAPRLVSSGGVGTAVVNSITLERGRHIAECNPDGPCGVAFKVPPGATLDFIVCDSHAGIPQCSAR